MKLVIIEGPGKQATIKKYLGDDFIVFASKGHVRDLPEKNLGIDINNNFKLNYEVMPDKKSVVNEMKKLASKADEILLATDPDREGEAISWHIAYILGLKPENKCRIAFNEISQTAVNNALKEPRIIDQNLVDAQQARRVLDRLVGYKVSPILSKRLSSKLSAGRVQSVALKLIVDREREIQSFVPQEYWTLNAVLSKNNTPFKALLTTKNSKKYTIKNANEMQEVNSILQNSQFIVHAVKREVKKIHPQPPFITSSMQQDAGNKLKMELSTITKVAQNLYEGVNTPNGKKALITYIRTDSTRVSQETQVKVKNYIINNYGEKYAPSKFNIYLSKESAQEGHECIRPIDITITPESVKDTLTRDQYRLYKLIYERFLASQMSDATFDSLTVDIKADVYGFKVTGKTPIFDGYNIVYKATEEENDKDESLSECKLPNMFEQDVLQLIKLQPEQKYTKPPVRYTEPSFVKLMENKGIGRPATYAQTVSVLFNRGYVIKENKYFIPTEIGFQVCDYLTENFKDIMDVKFTADMENTLDKISSGKTEWHEVIKNFYEGFEQQLAHAGASTVIETDEICPNCGNKLVIRNGKNGKFMACSNFPKCKYTKNLIEEKNSQNAFISEKTNELCPNCGANLITKMGKNGVFLSCPNYPNCKFSKSVLNREEESGGEIGLCPNCGKNVVQRMSKHGKPYYACTGYPKCKFMDWDLPLAEKCNVCGQQLYKRITKTNNLIYCKNKCISKIQNNKEEN